MERRQITFKPEGWTICLKIPAGLYENLTRFCQDRGLPIQSVLDAAFVADGVVSEEVLEEYLNKQNHSRFQSHPTCHTISDEYASDRFGN